MWEVNQQLWALKKVPKSVKWTNFPKNYNFHQILQISAKCTYFVIFCIKYDLFCIRGGIALFVLFLTTNRLLMEEGWWVAPFLLRKACQKNETELKHNTNIIMCEWVWCFSGLYYMFIRLMLDNICDWSTRLLIDNIFDWSFWCSGE